MSKASALRMDAEIKKVSQRGASQAALIAARLRTAALTAFRDKKKLTTRGIIVKQMRPLLVSTMIDATVLGQHFMRQLKPVKRGIRFDYESTLSALKKKSGLDLKSIEEQYDILALRILEDEDDEVNEELQEVVD